MTKLTINQPNIEPRFRQLGVEGVVLVRKYDNEGWGGLTGIETVV